MGRRGGREAGRQHLNRGRPKRHIGQVSLHLVVLHPLSLAR